MCCCKARPAWAKRCSANRSPARCGGVFKRVQGTADLMPADITGVHAFDAEQRHFVFRPGPVFADVLLVDEINRAGPKTQSALLEAMEERQVTVDRQNYRAAGQLPGHRDAEPARVRGHLPAARVAARSFHAAYRSQLSGARGRAGDPGPLRQHGRACALSTSHESRRRCDLAAAQADVEQVHVAPELSAPMWSIIAAASREHAHVSLGLSTRGVLALLRAARIDAGMRGARVRHAG